MARYSPSVHPLEAKDISFMIEAETTLELNGNDREKIFHSAPGSAFLKASAVFCLLVLLLAAIILVVIYTSSSTTACGSAKVRDVYPTSHQEFAFASYYQSNMVLQREPHHSVIWGYGIIGATVNISACGKAYSAKVEQGNDKCGVWTVKISPQLAGTLTDINGVHVSNGSRQFVRITNILFGDVFICSGQSNMQMTLSMVDNSCEELHDTVNYPDIRVFTVKPQKSATPLYDIAVIQQSWTVPSLDTMVGTDWTYFSGLCWLYGKYLYDELKIPIGLVASSRGGTVIEKWSSRAVFQACRNASLSYQTTQSYYSEHYNAMIHPLLNLTIKGVIWYQGESNSINHSDSYACMFPNMIRDWRQKWHDGSLKSTDPNFPFGFVQIAGAGNENPRYPITRWHQTADYGYVPNPEMENTFMAIAMDLPDPDAPHAAVHPRYKQDIASRLVAGALSVMYNRTVVPDGPFPDEATEIHDRTVIIRYPTSQQLVVADRGNFQICCTGQNCASDDPEVDARWRTTRILKSSDHTIVIDSQICTDSSTLVDKVRYAWALNPCDFKKCSVYNTFGFPGAPFIINVKRE